MATEILVHNFDGRVETIIPPNYSLDLMTVLLLKKMLVEQIFLNIGTIFALRLIHKGMPLDDDSAPLSRYVTSQDEILKVKNVHGGMSRNVVMPRFEIQVVKKVHGG